jgi:hypothetical protein
MNSHDLDLFALIAGALLFVEAIVVLLHQLGAIQMSAGGWAALGLGLMTLAGIGAVVQLVRTELRRTTGAESDSTTGSQIGG